MKRCTLMGAALLAVALVAPVAQAERIKDIAAFTGDGEWRVLGTGLVTGLAGTGDGSGFRASITSLVNSLDRMGQTVDESSVRSKNVAMVTVEASIPRTARPGTRVDVRVSSIGDAKSLEGGTLLFTALTGVTDGETYVVAAGAVSIGGFNVEGGANNRVQKNHPTVGVVTSGGEVYEQPPGLANAPALGVILNHPDHSTAANVARSVNAAFPGAARALDAGFIALTPPAALADSPVEFLAAVEVLEANTDTVSRVVFNERTGTIVVGSGVSIGEAAVAHGGLTIEIRTRFRVSQPNSFSENGETVIVPDVQTQVQESDAHVLRLPPMTTVQDIVDVLNGMGATPRDIIAILQALRTSGALQAEVVVL